MLAILAEEERETAVPKIAWSETATKPRYVAATLRRSAPHAPIMATAA